ncbi:MAG: M15 family metallopeptidase [Kineosporiaceae bacterium]
MLALVAPVFLEGAAGSSVPVRDGTASGPVAVSFSPGLSAVRNVRVSANFAASGLAAGPDGSDAASADGDGDGDTSTDARGAGDDSAGGVQRIERQPTDAEVREAQERAEALQGQAERQARTVTQARAALRAAADRAGLALERYRGSVLAQQEAQREAWAAEDRLGAADGALAKRRAVLGRWAHQAYADGLSLNGYPVAATLLTSGAGDDLDLTMATMRHLGDSWEADRRALERARQARQGAADEARRASDRALRASVDAERDRQAADRAVTEQRALLASLEGELSEAEDAAEDAERQADRLARARALAAQQGRINAVTGEVGECRGGDVTAYANGQIPLSVLCPLWGTSGEYLRADAAYAFGRLSQAYAARFGSPLCVTDSYRPYAEQVAVRAAKPSMAAVPGRSNHGWGTAVDLCGGIERFGTTTHEWMLDNAPLFGWFHPAWARPSGSLPEPWHWEYGG